MTVSHNAAENAKEATATYSGLRKSRFFLLAQHLFCSLADGGSVQTIQLEQIPGRAGAAELILHAHTADGGGALLAQDGTDSLAQTADDIVLLGSDDLAALLGRLEDDVLIQGA